jgi:hypothetical protein
MNKLTCYFLIVIFSVIWFVGAVDVIIFLSNLIF